MLPIQYQLVEGDLLDFNNSQSVAAGHYVVQGIEFDATGKKVAYWVYDKHPNEYLGFMAASPQSRRAGIPRVPAHFR